MKADRKLVVQAFMADLTAIKKSDAEKLVDCILETHKSIYPNFIDKYSVSYFNLGCVSGSSNIQTNG